MGQDSLGDRMKVFEGIEADRKLVPLLPIMVRLDGRSFSRFTRDLPKPFSEKFHQAMVETTKTLIEESGARIGYTQSDEISLVLYSDDYKSQLLFDGRISKLTSVLASIASVQFNQSLNRLLPEKSKECPVFDCRVWSVPNKEEAANTILWRCRDAAKNSVSMAAFAVFSPKQLFGKHQAEQQQMLLEQANIDWTKYPEWFKNGTFMRRVLVEQAPDVELIEKLRVSNRLIPATIKRHKIVELEMPPFGKVANRTEVIFDGANPIMLAAV